jgi:hypothetical protein
VRLRARAIKGDSIVTCHNSRMGLQLLLEGNSVSSAEWLTEVHHTTILKLLVLASQSARTAGG